MFFNSSLRIEFCNENDFIEENAYEAVTTAMSNTMSYVLSNGVRISQVQESYDCNELTTTNPSINTRRHRQLLSSSSSSYTDIDCGNVILSSNVNKTNYIGNPSGDMIFRFTTSSPIRFRATTCSTQTMISTSLSLYDIYPPNITSSSSSSLTTDEDIDFGCSILFYDMIENSIDYWLVVQGSNNDNDEGIFELSISCSIVPTPQPSLSPTSVPTSIPTPKPTSLPTFAPTMVPTPVPSPVPTPVPTSVPTLIPTSLPTHLPTPIPSSLPSSQPTPTPTTATPSQLPTRIPTIIPSFIPSPYPTPIPTLVPTPQPSSIPTPQPTFLPTLIPTLVPTPTPTTCEAVTVSLDFNIYPIYFPQFNSTELLFTTIQNNLSSIFLENKGLSFNSHLRSQTQLLNVKSLQSSQVGTSCCDDYYQIFEIPQSYSLSQVYIPTSLPTSLPTIGPSSLPTIIPTPEPSSTPSHLPTYTPSSEPTEVPTPIPTHSPSSLPTIKPSLIPTSSPSLQPSSLPTIQPSLIPSSVPTLLPSSSPTSIPSSLPTSSPTSQPSSLPSFEPSSIPTSQPTHLPTTQPTYKPTPQPSLSPSSSPTHIPTSSPTKLPTTELRGFKDCVCFSSSVITSLKKYCPEIIQYFSAHDDHTCLKNITIIEFDILAENCIYLQDTN